MMFIFQPAQHHIDTSPPKNGCLQQGQSFLGFIFRWDSHLRMQLSWKQHGCVWCWRYFGSIPAFVSSATGTTFSLPLFAIGMLQWQRFGAITTCPSVKVDKQIGHSCGPSWFLVAMSSDIGVIGNWILHSTKSRRIRSFRLMRFLVDGSDFCEFSWKSKA